MLLKKITRKRLKRSEISQNKVRNSNGKHRRKIKKEEIEWLRTEIDCVRKIEKSGIKYSRIILYISIKTTKKEISFKSDNPHQLS